MTTPAPLFLLPPSLPSFPSLLSLLLPPFSSLPSSSIPFLFSSLLFLFFSLFSSHRVEGDISDPKTVEQRHASDHQVEGESSFNNCTCICTNSIASFLDHSCLQFWSLAVCRNGQRGKAWECMMSGTPCRHEGRREPTNSGALRTGSSCFARAA